MDTIPLALHYLHHGMHQTDAALLAIRLTVGTFFILSGYHKLFNKERHVQFVETLRACHVPYLSINQWFVPSVEFFGGIAVFLGFFAPLAALGMLIILLVALATDGLSRIPAYKPIDKADYLDDVLYLPEVIYAVMLIIIIVDGPGGYSVPPSLLFSFFE